MATTVVVVHWQKTISTCARKEEDMSSYSEGQTHQLMDTLENAGFTPADITALGQFQNLPLIKAVLAGRAGIKVAELLCKLTAIKVSGVMRFCVQDHIQEANVGWTHDNFEGFFFKKVEENVDNATIAVHRLERMSLNTPIIAELGNRAEIQLAHFFELLKAQSKGERGVLLVNGSANIAYIRGADKKVWAVDAYWLSDYGCWRVGAIPVGHPSWWLGGYQVLSRDS